MPDNLSITTMSRSEFDIAIDWAAAEGWNPGLHDGDCYFAADPEGFLLGRVDGEPVATISVVRYRSFGFLGFYIVHPAWRGRGCGLRIWQAGMQRLDGYNVGLDGVVDQQDNYRKSGFKLAWRNMRYEGIRTPHTQVATDPRIVTLDSVPFDALAAWERPFFPAPRTNFLRAWITRPGSVALGIVEAGALVGHGVLRPCRNGWKLAPLHADRPELAGVLFDALTAHVPAGQPFFLDVPEGNREAIALAERNGMQPSFETARMYTGQPPQLPLARIFGINSFEIG
jgi:predicted N-acetyltransferase YhbS